MTILSILLAVFLIQLAVLIALLFISIHFNHISKAIQPYLKDIENIKKKTAEEEKEVLEQAIKSSKEIFANAVTEVKSTLEVSEETKAEIEDKLNSAINESVSKAILIFQNHTNTIVNQYQTKLTELSQKQLAELKMVTDDTSKTANKQMSDLAMAIEKEAQQIRQNVEERTNQEMDQVKQELNAYKQQKLKEIDASVFSILEETAKLSLGKSIDLASHQELVLKALEKAKEEKLFGHD